MLDTVRLTETPEGIELSLRLAGPSIRACAWVLDVLFRALCLGVLAIPLAFMGLMGEGLLFMIWFVLEWIYPVLFEVKAHGATPGKKIMGLRVVHDDGSPVGWPAAINRNLLRAADFLPLGYGFGLITMLFHPDYKRLGDMAANTLVVYRDKAESDCELPHSEPLPLMCALTLAEQRSIIHFAERSHYLSRERQEELAEILSPLIPATPNQREPVDALFGIAASLMGKS